MDAMVDGRNGRWRQWQMDAMVDGRDGRRRQWWEDALAGGAQVGFLYLGTMFFSQ